MEGQIFTIDKKIGIDLGTTNSVAAIMDMNNEDVMIHYDEYARKTLPSAVATHPVTGKIITGYLAKSYRGTHNAPVLSMKRKMGQPRKLKTGDRRMTPEEISTEIIKDCVARMKKRLDCFNDGTNRAISRATVTIPAYFDHNAREATRRAGEAAGLKVDLLQEPTAAAVYYIRKYGLPPGAYLVYDLGGGTFDVSIINKRQGYAASILGLSGDNRLGGDDFDRLLAEDLLTRLQESGEYDLDLDLRPPKRQTQLEKLVAQAIELADNREAVSDLLDEIDLFSGDIKNDAPAFTEQFIALVERARDEATSDEYDHLKDTLVEIEEYALLLWDENAEDRERFEKLVTKAVDLKEELSEKEQVYFRSRNLFEDKMGRTVSIDMPYTRKRFEELIGALVETTLNKCDEALDMAVKSGKLSGIHSIEQILMVGGSTRIPLVQKLVTEKFRDVKNNRIICDEPDLAVAYGAALCATVDEVMITDENGSGIGIIQDEYNGELEIRGRLLGPLEKESAGEIRIKASDNRVIMEGAIDGDTFSFDGFACDIGESLAVEIKMRDGRTYLYPLRREINNDIIASPVYLSKNINIDAYSDNENRVVKYTLLPAGARLPEKSEYKTLYANVGTKDFIKFNLYQGFDLIQTFSHDLKESGLAPGDAFQIRAICDVDFKITIEGNVKGKPIHFEAAAAARRFDRQTLTKQFKELNQEYMEKISPFQFEKPEDAGNMNVNAIHYRAAILSGLKSDDLAAVNDKIALYREMLDGMFIVPLSPSREEFESLKAEINSLKKALRAKISKLPAEDRYTDMTAVLFNENEIDEKLVEITASADIAYKKRSIESVKACNEQLAKLYNFLDSLNRKPPETRLVALLTDIQFCGSRLEYKLTEDGFLPDEKAEKEKTIKDAINELTALRIKVTAEIGHLKEMKDKTDADDGIADKNADELRKEFMAALKPAMFVFNNMEMRQIDAGGIPTRL